MESTIGGLDTGAVETTLGGDGNPVYNAVGAGSAFHGAANFNQWYNDVAGVNTATTYSLMLDNTITADSDVYTFSDSSFFPIDGMLFGNEGNSHNYHFTLETHTMFTYQGGEFFNFTGDDDLWVFINDQLAVDLGGVHGAVSGGVDLDTLGLTAGQDYSFDLFFAERHTTQSNFRIDTSIALRPNDIPEPSTLAMLGLGMLGLSFRLRQKQVC
jgi:fibro-slime domain-containing protein